MYVAMVHGIRKRTLVNVLTVHVTMVTVTAPFRSWFTNRNITLSLS